MGHDGERGRQLGLDLWNPHVRFDRHSFSFLEPLARAFLEAGVRGAALDPAVEDLDEFTAGVWAGLEEGDKRYDTETDGHRQKAQCDPNGRYPMCEYCQRYAAAVEASVRNRRRWEAETKAPQREFALTPGQEGKIHTRDCPAVLREIRTAEAVLENLTPYAAYHGGVTADWPYLLDRAAAIARNRDRCRICVPDLPDRVRRRQQKGPDGRFHPPTEATV